MAKKKTGTYFLYTRTNAIWLHYTLNTVSHLVARGIPRYFEPRPELKSDINHRPEPEC